MTLDVRRLVEDHRHDALAAWGETMNPQFERVVRAIGYDRTFVRAEGAYLWDEHGRRYLDGLAGHGMFSVGRNNPRVRAALEQALALDLPASLKLGATPLPPLLARELLRRTPERLARVLFTSSGTEGVEAAIKIARSATRRRRLLSLENGFHGLTLGGLSVAGLPELKQAFAPLVPDCAAVPVGDLDALEDELRREDVALFIVEPVLGTDVVLHPSGYLEGAQALCRGYGTLFCVDEVQTGLGRTGRMFAIEHWGLEPDMLILAKALSGGYVPVGALLMSREAHELGVCESPGGIFTHGSTFAPNEFAMVAALATLHELDEGRLVERAERLGRALLQLTEPLVDEFEVVADVRGLGFLWGLELAQPAAGSWSYRLLERLQSGLFAQLLTTHLLADHGVLLHVSRHARTVVKATPPLVLTEDDVAELAAALATAVAATGVRRAAARFRGAGAG